MPTYEYACPAGHRYEKREGFDAPASQRCAQCRRTAKRVLFAPPIVFKGSGFYVTDSRKPALSGAEGSSSPSESDAKPDAAPDTKADTTKADTKSETPSAGTSSSTKDAEPAAAG